MDTERSIRLTKTYSVFALERLLDNSRISEFYQHDPITIKIHDTLTALGLFETLQIIVVDKLAADFREIIEQ